MLQRRASSSTGCTEVQAKYIQRRDPFPTADERSGTSNLRNCRYYMNGCRSTSAMRMGDTKKGKKGQPSLTAGLKAANFVPDALHPLFFLRLPQHASHFHTLALHSRGPLDLRPADTTLLSRCSKTWDGRQAGEMHKVQRCSDYKREGALIECGGEEVPTTGRDAEWDGMPWLASGRLLGPFFFLRLRPMHACSVSTTCKLLKVPDDR